MACGIAIDPGKEGIVAVCRQFNLIDNSGLGNRLSQFYLTHLDPVPVLPDKKKSDRSYMDIRGVIDYIWKIKKSLPPDEKIYAAVECNPAIPPDGKPQFCKDRCPKCGQEVFFRLPSWTTKKTSVWTSHQTGWAQSVWVTAFTGLRIPVLTPVAQTWMSYVGALKARQYATSPTDKKRISCAALEPYFPGVDLRRTPRCTTPDHNRGDALCLLAWLMRQFDNEILNERPLERVPELALAPQVMRPAAVAAKPKGKEELF